MTTEMNWDSEVDPDAQSGRTLVAEGVVEFSVLSLKRVRKEFGKCGTINVAEITLLVQSLKDPEEPVEVMINLGLHSTCQWKITEFFTAIGQRKHGDTGKFVPRWDKIEGKSGYAINEHKTRKSKKTGNEYTVNELAKFITEEEVKAENEKSGLNF
jgi:hypothetical protein